MPEPAHSRRIVKAVDALARVADPLERLDAVRQARETLEALEHRSAADARASGATWSEIGALYGVSKQAAQQRFRAQREPSPKGRQPKQPKSGPAQPPTSVAEPEEAPDGAVR